jgi:putative Holliday junction resolvase
MTKFFFKDLSEIQIDGLIASGSGVIGLDVGNKTVGIAVSDRRIKVASGITTTPRNGTDKDFELLLESVKSYRIGLVIVGWPLQTNGLAGEQCEKVLQFASRLSQYVDADFAKWDERFSTKVVDDFMIQADWSRKKRKKIVNHNAAAYILQGALDFLNNRIAL